MALRFLHPTKRPGPPFEGLLLLALLLSLCGAVHGQQLTLAVRNTPFTEVLRLVEAQSPYRFVFLREELAGVRPLSFSVRSASIDSVLVLLLQGQPLTAVRMQELIVLQRRQVVPPLERRTFRGVVRDEEGAGIDGATVRLKDSSAGTVARADGTFRLVGGAPGDTLVISAVGFLPQEVPLQPGRSVTLTRSSRLLDETVVIGYGRTTRRLATGSVSQVPGRALRTTAALDAPLLALQGRATGVEVWRASGLADAPLTVRVRGQHSLESGSDPLILLDGVPVGGGREPLLQRSGLQALAAFLPLPAGALQSIEVLKDGAATAIYGSRGAAGVVLLTTRPPAEGPAHVTVQLREGRSRAARTPAYLSTPAYLQLRREAFAQDSMMPTPATAPDLTRWDTARDQHWTERLIGGTARSSEVNLELNGGRNGTAYRFLGKGDRQTTVYPGNFHSRRATALLQGRHQAAEGKWTLSGALLLSGDRHYLPAQDLTAATALPPNLYDPYDSSGRLRWQEGGQSAGNPLAAVHQPLQASGRQLFTSLSARYRLHPRLEVSSLWGGQRQAFSERLRVPIASQDPARSPTGSVSSGEQAATLWVWEPALSAQLPATGALQGSLQAGATLQESRRNTALVTASGYTDDVLLGDLQQAPQLSAAGSATLYRYSGLYARFSGAYRHRYRLELTGRRDGSSRFGPGRQSAFFGAVGAAWLFGEAPWVRQHLPGLSYGKLRLSWGTAGNDQIGDYRFYDTWNPAPAPYSGHTAWKAGRLYNPAFGWERTRKWEAALEAGILQERLLLTVALYRHRSGNQILRGPLPAQSGFTFLLRNVPALLENRGGELAVSYQSRPLAPLRYTASLTLTLPRSRLLAFPPLPPGAHAYLVDRPLNSYSGYRYRGVDPGSGLYLFEDRNGDGTLDESDYTYTGTTEPRLHGGSEQELAWKGWSLLVHLSLVQRQGLHPLLRSGVAPGDLINMPREVEDRWRRPGDRAVYQRATQHVRSEAYYPATLRVARSSAALTGAGYLRLGSLQLSYQRKAHPPGTLQEWQVFVQVLNALTLSRYPGDPEVQVPTVLPLLQSLEVGGCFTF